MLALGLTGSIATGKSTVLAALKAALFEHHTVGGAVREAMTPKVKICNENHTVNELMEIMTAGRFRHLPVEKNGLLDGIVSIGDVVKKRIEDVEREAEEIRAYIATA